MTKGMRWHPLPFPPGLGKGVLNHLRLFGLLIVFAFTSAVAQINTDNVLLMGRSAIGSEDYLMAIHYFNQVIEAKPFLNKAYYYRAYAKYCLDDYTGAEADCSQAILINPFLIDVFQLRGLCRLRRGNFSGAAKDYTSVLFEMPDDQGARYNRGLCYLQLRCYNAAEADMQALLSKWPNFDRAYALRAQIAFEQRDTVGGIKWLDKLLAHNQSDAAAWSFKGRYALNKGNYALADSLLSIAIKYRPNLYENYLVRALARHGQNHFGAAIADYDKVISLIPQHFVAHYNRGLLRALVGENNRAIDDFSFVIAREPNNTLAIYNRALLRQQTGDYNGAIADFTRIIHQYPHFLYGYAARAECRRKVGNIHGALNDESVIAKANLDIMFAKKQRRPIKRVRRSSEHNLDQYDQLVDDNSTDSTSASIGTLLADDLFGRVQDQVADIHPLPPFILTFRQITNERGFHSSGFMPEVAALERYLLRTPLYFSADMQMAGNNLTSIGTPPLLAHIHNVADSLLLVSVSESDTYNYADALKTLQRASSVVTTAATKWIIHLQRVSILCRLHLVESMGPTAHLPKKSSASTLDNSPLTSALAEAQVTIQQIPGNAFAHYALGSVCLLTDDAQGAVAALTRALQIDNRLAEAYYNRGLAYLQLNKKTEAQTDFSRAGELGLYRAYALLKQTR